MRYVDDLQKQVDTDRDQTDAKQDTHLLTDGRKDEILFHIRDCTWCARVNPHAKPPACPDAKQGLGNLIPGGIDVIPWIEPRRNTHAHMVKHKIRYIRRRAPSRKPGYQIPHLARGDKQQNDVGDKIDQGTSQILGRCQEQYMDSRQHRGEHDMHKTLGF